MWGRNGGTGMSQTKKPSCVCVCVCGFPSLVYVVICACMGVGVLVNVWVGMCVFVYARVYRLLSIFVYLKQSLYVLNACQLLCSLSLSFFFFYLFLSQSSRSEYRSWEPCHCL